MLFEYCSSIEPVGNRSSFESFLKQLWSKRYFAYAQEYVDDLDLGSDELKVQKQPFLRFDGNDFRTQNFVGFIQFNEQLIEIYPKVFHSTSISKEEILKHIFYWFGYCRKLYFPVIETSLDSLNVDSIPELLIWNFADYCLKTISTQPFNKYETVEESLYVPKGRIDFSAYIKNGLSTGNYHKIDCIHEPFLYDNKLNRGIKYVCRLLLNLSKMKETRSKLEEILFLLDEVEDTPCTSAELETVFLSPMFNEYAPIKEWCKRFLDQQLYSSSSYNSMQWSLLLPMEYVFEDFILGFMKEHFGSYFEIHGQKSDYYLTEENVFQLRHDILLKAGKTCIILDTKYKVREGEIPTDLKKGVSQTDMYQMLSYAYRRGCNKIIMLYPSSAEYVQPDASFKIASDFENKPDIEIQICDIPFWSEHSISDLKGKLISRLQGILK